MAAVRRPPLLLLSGWIGVTAAAVAVAWIGVRPVAEQQIAEPPRVPRPELVAPPGADSPPPKRAPVDIRATPNGRRPASTRPRDPESSRAPRLPTPTPGASSASPSRSASASPSPRAPSESPSPSATPRDDPLVREASSTGGDAAFAYHADGVVSLVDVVPRDGWEAVAYRMEADWVVVEFERYGHRSTVHAYVSTDRRACIEVVEEAT